MRIYEFTKQIDGVTSKELVEMLVANGFDVQTHMSILTEDAQKFLNKKFAKKSKDAAPKAVKSSGTPSKPVSKSKSNTKKKRAEACHRKAFKH